MSYKNSMKLFASNFNLVWKQVLFFFINLIIFGILSYEVAKPIINLIDSSEVGEEISLFFNSFYEGHSVISIFEIAKHILFLIAANFSAIYGNLILLFIVGFVLPFLIHQISRYNLCSIVYKKLSMNMPTSYFRNLMETLKNSVVYALTNFILSLPFWSVKVLLCEIYLTFSNGIIAKYFGLVILVGLLILISSVHNAVFAIYTGNAVETEKFAPVAFGSNMSKTFSQFGAILSTMVIMELTVVIANGFGTLFTFFSGLVVFAPATMVLRSICYVVVYCNKMGQRYYLNNSFIYNPVKYTIKQDEMGLSHYGEPEEKVYDEVISTSIEQEQLRKTKKKNRKKS